MKPQELPVTVLPTDRHGYSTTTDVVGRIRAFVADTAPKFDALGVTCDALPELERIRNDLDALTQVRSACIKCELFRAPDGVGPDTLARLVEWGVLFPVRADDGVTRYRAPDYDHADALATRLALYAYELMPRAERELFDATPPEERRKLCRVRGR